MTNFKTLLTFALFSGIAASAQTTTVTVPGLPDFDPGSGLTQRISTVTITLNPADGAVTGAAGTPVTWGFNLSWASNAGDYVVFTSSSLNGDASNVSAGYTDLLGPVGGPNNGALAPGDTWSQNPGNLQLRANAAPGSEYSGQIRIDGNVFDGPPGGSNRLGQFSFVLNVKATVDFGGLGTQSQTITFGTLADVTYGVSPVSLTATASSLLPVTLVSQTESVCTLSGNALTIVGAGVCTVTADQAGDGNYLAATTVSQSFNVARRTPVLSWVVPAAITFGSALASGQLRATANVPGTFTYQPPAGTVLSTGSGQVLSAFFTPTDTATYENGTVSTTLDINPAPAATTPASITVTRTLARTGGNLVVTVTLTNTGGSPAANVVLSSVKIGTASGTPAPQTIGTIAGGASATATVLVPGTAGASGSSGTIVISGTYTGGTFSSSARVTLP